MDKHEEKIEYFLYRHDVRIISVTETAFFQFFFLLMQFFYDSASDMAGKYVLRA